MFAHAARSSEQYLIGESHEYGINSVRNLHLRPEPNPNPLFRRLTDILDWYHRER
jgi:hypothetical protein